MAAALPWSRWHQFLRVVLGIRARFPGYVSPDVLASWRRRLERVRLLLASDSHGAMSWYWRAHERVLGFMLSRYASGAAAPSAREAMAAPAPSPPESPARTLPAELVPAAAPQFVAPDPQMIERARTGLLDIARANLAADKPPPPVFVPPPRRLAGGAVLGHPEVEPVPGMTACIVGGAILFQIPFLLFIVPMFGDSPLGLGLGAVMVLTSIVVAIELCERRARRPKPVAWGPPRTIPPTCPRCACNPRDIPRGRCPECGGPT